MTDALIYAGTLTASQTDRTATGLLVPFGEPCASNLGRFEVGPGVMQIPADFAGVGLNIEHEREQVVGALYAAKETPTGIVGSFRFAQTPEGDQALADARSGKRSRLSVESSGVIIRGGKAIAGRIFGAALVKAGAFPSATLLAAAVDVELEPGDPVVSSYSTEEEFIDENGVRWKRVYETESTTETTATETGETSTTTTTTVASTEQLTEEQEPTVGAATVPGTTLTAAKPKLTVARVGELLYAAREGRLSEDDLREQLKGQNGDTLFAALSDVKLDGTGGIGATIGMLPQWVGELWNALNYKQQVLPLFNHADLTSMTVNGFRWTQKPAGGDWAGNKADVPSNTLTVQAVTAAAARYAIGHDIAREFLDFNVPGFFESYASAVTEDYARWADAKAATAAVAGATVLAADALTTLPGPTGGTIGSAASAIVDGATVIVQNGYLPDFALVAPALWKQLVKQPKNNVIGYLNAALGLAEGDLAGFTIRPSASVAAGKVLVGMKQAVTVYELPGVPIRVDALDLAKGGVDKAAFGYLGLIVNDARGLQLVTAATS